MRRVASLVAIAVACAAPCAHCGASDLSPAADGGALDAASDVATEHAADAGRDAGPPTAYLRVANLAPGAPPVDVCIAQHGTTAYVGPIVASLASIASGVDGSTGSVAYPGASAYFSLDPGTYDAWLTTSGACDGSGPTTALPALAANDAATIAYLAPSGDAGAPLVAMVLADDASPPAASALRVFHAIAGAPSLDFGWDAPWFPLFEGLTYGAIAEHVAPSSGALDANGYLAIAPVASTPFAARPSGADAASDVASTSLSDFAANVTAFAIGAVGDPAHPPSILVCTDDVSSGGVLSDCR